MDANIHACMETYIHTCNIYIHRPTYIKKYTEHRQKILRILPNSLMKLPLSLSYFENQNYPSTMFLLTYR